MNCRFESNRWAGMIARDSVPVVCFWIGRLAVDRRFQGQGLGSALLVDSLFRAIKADIAAYTAFVDAKDDRAAAFYRHHGFLDLDSNQRILFIPLARLMETSN